jgi:type IV secretory pathway VirB10-like protein
MEPRTRPWWKRNRVYGAGAVSACAHLGLLLALILLHPNPAPQPPPPPVVVELVQPAPQPAPTPTPQPPAPHAASVIKKPPPKQKIVAHVLARPVPQARPEDAAPIANAAPGLTDAQLAGATSADGEGSGAGGGCNMLRRVQMELRQDQLVKDEVAHSGARAILVWNGDWVQAQSEDGKGMKAVRQAIELAVAFSPAACRTEQVRGFVLISLNGTRLAMGSGVWRWSDLLNLSSARP